MKSESVPLTAGGCFWNQRITGRSAGDVVMIHSVDPFTKSFDEASRLNLPRVRAQMTAFNQSKHKINVLMRPLLTPDPFTL